METFALPLAVLIGVVLYFALVRFLPTGMIQKDTVYLRSAIGKLQGADLEDREEVRLRLSKQFDMPDNLWTRAFLLIPGAESLLPVLDRAGMLAQLPKLFTIGLAVFLITLLVFASAGVLAIFLAMIATWLVCWLYLNNARKKRLHEFLDAFPDSLDMMGRSVRAGYPVNGAISMVSETRRDWIGDEFQRIVDESSYGMPLTESVTRFSERLGQADAKFFAVVLSVQQESGGNLSEVLQNLSRVIRERKKLRLKIRALSSEGRATAWILGILPFMMVGAVHYFSPDHLEPLWTTPEGNAAVVFVGLCLFMGFMLIRKIINIDI